MEIRHNMRTMEHLTNLVTTRNQNIPNFALLVGSGASRYSGILTARDMVENWRALLYERSGKEKGFGEWVREQHWYKHDDEYSLLFELMYDQPSQRRVYIEECVAHAHPTWGYVYLTNLLKHDFFNVVLTTNFDDLITEACFLYSDGLRPVICAHDSAVSGIRVTSKRPKIIKLHGDFLYDNIKNTIRELETLEENMKRKLMQFAQEYGLVVVGYSGRDRSVMDVLEMLIKDEEHFKNGIYWCVRPADEIGNRLQSLLRRDRVYCVEVPGFDEFMAYVHSKATLSLPPPVADPIRVAQDRARLFVNVNDLLKMSPIISEDIRQVLKGLEEVVTISEAAGTPEDLELLQSKQRRLAHSIPFSLTGAVAGEKGDLEGALQHYRRALADDPDDSDVAKSVAETLAKLGRRDELRVFAEQAPLLGGDKAYFLLHAQANERAMAVASEAISADPTDEIARINRAIALKRLGQVNDMESELVAIEELEPDENVRAGIAALRRNKNQMLEFLGIAIAKRLISVENVRMFVVFEDYWEDHDLVAFLGAVEGAGGTAGADSSLLA